MIQKNSFSFLFFFLFLLPTLPSQEGKQTDSQITLKTRVDKAVATTDQSLRLTLSLTKPKSFSDLTLPEIGDQLDGLRIVEFGEEKPQQDDDQITLQRWYKLQADISGSYIIPALKINYKDPVGRDHLLKTSEIFVEIQPLKKQNNPQEGGEKTTKEKDIRGLKDLAPVGWHPLWKILSWVAGIFFLATLLLILLRGRKKEQPQKPTLSPQEKALQKLKALQKQSPENLKQYKKYYFELSEISKTYFEDRFQYPATDRTTEEWERDLQEQKRPLQDLDHQKGQLFTQVLREADKVKFTDYLPTPTQKNQVLKNIISFIKSTQSLPDANPKEAKIKKATQATPAAQAGDDFI